MRRATGERPSIGRTKTKTPAHRQGGPGSIRKREGACYFAAIFQATLVSSFALMLAFCVTFPSFSCQSSTS